MRHIDLREQISQRARRCRWLHPRRGGRQESSVTFCSQTYGSGGARRWPQHEAAAYVDGASLYQFVDGNTEGSSDPVGLAPGSQPTFPAPPFTLPTPGGFGSVVLGSAPGATPWRYTAQNASVDTFLRDIQVKCAPTAATPKQSGGKCFHIKCRVSADFEIQFRKNGWQKWVPAGVNFNRAMGHEQQHVNSYAQEFANLLAQYADVSREYKGEQDAMATAQQVEQQLRAGMFRIAFYEGEHANDGSPSRHTGYPGAATTGPQLPDDNDVSPGDAVFGSALGKLRAPFKVKLSEFEVQLELKDGIINKKTFREYWDKRLFP